MEAVGLLDDSTLESFILKKDQSFGVSLIKKEPLGTMRVLGEYTSETMIGCGQDDVLELNHFI